MLAGTCGKKATGKTVWRTDLLMAKALLTHAVLHLRSLPVLSAL
jgi:hypothetical protein